MEHGIKIDMVPTKYGGLGEMTVDGDFIPFDFDNEKLFIKIQKPTQEEMDVYDWYELTSPVVHPRRKHDKLVASDIPIQEWRKRLAWQPQDVVDKTLINTTQHYLRVECESRNDPRGHIKTRTPGLRQKG